MRDSMPDPIPCEHLSDEQYLEQFDRFLAEFDARHIETVQDFVEVVAPIVIEAVEETT